MLFVFRYDVSATTAISLIKCSYDANKNADNITVVGNGVVHRGNKTTYDVGNSCNTWQSVNKKKLKNGSFNFGGWNNRCNKTSRIHGRS